MFFCRQDAALSLLVLRADRLLARLVMEDIVFSSGQQKAAVPAIAAIDLSLLFFFLTNEHLHSIKNFFLFFSCVSCSKHQHTLNKSRWLALASFSLERPVLNYHMQTKFNFISIPQVFCIFSTSIHTTASHESVTSIVAATLCSISFIWPWRPFYCTWADRKRERQTNGVNRPFR